ncbi:hypothetical protein BCR44DRAFT_1106257 [Catenaria anguillulae PL171]|uniref:Uncharacterized protein n=1 Tax=Catenaria anguillulae PL171 TaxID=765915 RepID=A0A1Y2HM85_9FUNG|nr:hypothetical protein BCR44DRAFT_1106257 [Catenaria anguillulae PL171]
MVVYPLRGSYEDLRSGFQISSLSCIQRGAGRFCASRVLTDSWMSDEMEGEWRRVPNFPETINQHQLIKRSSARHVSLGNPQTKSETCRGAAKSTHLHTLVKISHATIEIEGCPNPPCRIHSSLSTEQARRSPTCSQSPDTMRPSPLPFATFASCRPPSLLAEACPAPAHPSTLAAAQGTRLAVFSVLA